MPELLQMQWLRFLVRPVGLAAVRVGGLPLFMPYRSETIDGCTVHTYNDDDLIACFDENIPDTNLMCNRNPQKIF